MLKTLPEKRRERGFVSIYVFVSSFFVLIPVGGLAVDLGVLYNVQAKLQSAVDAAAIGAGYQLHASTSLTTSEITAIQNAAQLFFNANYPTGYWASTSPSFSATPANGSNGTKTITVSAEVTVPMLLLRVLGVSTSQVGAFAQSSVRWINMVIVVDRSGSVEREGANTTIVNALDYFVASPGTSYLTSGTDTVGMYSFGGTWYEDYAPNTNFCTSTGSCGIQTAINSLQWANSGTNTAEGLYQAWTQLYATNQPSAMNVIVLLTDGRPSGFTGSFTAKTGTGHCASTPISGVLQAYVGLGWPPPTTDTGDTLGLIKDKLTYPPALSDSNNVEETNYPATPDTGCAYASNITNIPSDVPNFPASAGPVSNVGSSYNPTYISAGGGTGTGLSTQTGYYPQSSTSTTPAQYVRYAGFNVAYNLATMIHNDTTLQPIIFGVGLNYSDQCSQVPPFADCTSGSVEPLDPDFVAYIANDPHYLAMGTNPATFPAGKPVYSSGTQGYYCNAYQNPTASENSLTTCFENFTAQLLRLSK